MVGKHFTNLRTEKPAIVVQNVYVLSKENRNTSQFLHSSLGPVKAETEGGPGAGDGPHPMQPVHISEYSSRRS